MDNNTEEKKNIPAGSRHTDRKGPRRFTISMQKKLVVMFLITLLLFGVLGTRLFLINRDNGTNYSMQVLSQQAYDNETIPYKRGEITDAKGTVLANSQLVYSVIVDAKQILEEKRYLNPTLDALESLGVDRDFISNYIRNHPNSQYYIALRNLSYQDKTAYEKRVRAGIRKEEKDNISQEDRTYSNIEGIWFQSGYKRYYPHSTMACDVLGYASTSNQGSFGLEEYYNDTLNGTEGRSYGYIDDSLNLEKTTIEPTDGNNLQLTLDANIQSIVEKYLKQFNDQYQDGPSGNEGTHDGYGENNVACVIQNIHTGAILAMASYPNFDLNNPDDTSVLVGMPVLDDKDAPTDEYLTQEQVDNLSDKDKSRYLNALWKNFCISDYYEPGSTAKPFTVAAGLETGKVKDSDKWECPGYLDVDGTTIRCHSYSNGGDGTITTGEAIERSCNVALMKMALKEGQSVFSKFQNIFNFGLKTNIDLAGEVRTDSMLIPEDQMSNIDLATNSFGQNFYVTMIQMITGFSSLINGGNYYQPYLVDKITTPSGATVSQTQPRLLKKTVSEDTSSLIRDYCLQVVEGENGTGSTARPAGYRIGGKTGTAETIPRGEGNYVVSFMGYAPYEDPQIAIYVVVDRPNVGTDAEEQADAKYATGIVRNILTEVLPYMNIYMTEPVTDEEKAELDALGLKVTYDGDSSSTESTATESTATEGDNSSGEESSADQNN